VLSVDCGRGNFGKEGGFFFSNGMRKTRYRWFDDKEFES
jgi:hypothetical protein